MGCKQRQQDLVLRQPARERDAHTQIESIRETGGVPTGLGEISEQATNEPNAGHRVHVEEQLHTRSDAGDARRAPVVDLQGSEDKEPRSATMAHAIGDELPRGE
jgi:hypothetical protein